MSRASRLQRHVRQLAKGLSSKLGKLLSITCLTRFHDCSR